jgi:glutathione S-transferase
MKPSVADLHLIGQELCPYVQRARVVLNEKAVPYRMTFIDLEAKPAWFLDISPLRRVPVLLVDDRPLFESLVIAEYVDESTPGSLLPEDAFERASARAWIEFSSDLLNQLSALLFARDEPALQSALKQINDRLSHLERVLGDGPYFLGKNFSLVDAAFAPIMRYFDIFDARLDLGLFRDRPALQTWRAALAKRASVRDSAVPGFEQRFIDYLTRKDNQFSRLLLESH